MYERTLTIFNFHKGTWYPTTVYNCDLKVRVSSNLTINGINDVGSVNIVIHCTKEKKVNALQGVKQFVDPKDYNRLEDPSGYFTLTPEVDFILEGSWSDPVVDDDYDLGFYDHMNTEKDGVHMIQASQYYTLLPHFEIGAK